MNLKELANAQIAPAGCCESPVFELFIKWILPVELRLQLVTLITAEPSFPMKVVFPVNIRLLSWAVMPPPSVHVEFVTNSSQLHINSLFPVTVMLVSYTTSVVPTLLWKEQLTSSAFCTDSKNSVALKLELPKFLPHEVKVREWILKSPILLKLKPTDPLQIILAT